MEGCRGEGGRKPKVDVLLGSLGSLGDDGDGLVDGVKDHPVAAFSNHPQEQECAGVEERS